jgi:hypothetical protein
VQVQLLDTHVALTPQAFPHEPQLLPLLDRLTQPAPGQQLWPPVQAGPPSGAEGLEGAHVQRKDESHPSFMPHEFVQLPHVAGLVSDASHPVDISVSQFWNPGLQLPIRQLPPTHDPLAFAGAQSAPHDPQCAVETSTSDSQPSLPLTLLLKLQSR